MPSRFSGARWPPIARCASIVAAAAALQGAGDAPLQSAPDGRRLALTFSDDFDSFRRLGSPGGVWRTTFGDGSEKGLDRRTLPDNGELELYVDARLADVQGAIGLDPFRAHDGYLDIAATPTPKALISRLDGHPYVSGVITTQPSFSQTYGYFEMRAKLPSGRGLWPAFWLLPADQSWPPEIDVMESVGDSSRIYSTAHSTLRPAPDLEARVSPAAFHIYAVSWDRARLVWYVDGREIGQEPTPPDLHKPMYMLANLAVGGNWPGAPDTTTMFPAKLTIDYIRAYRFANE
jgi:beta-glucanase (GH16 family)